MIGIKFADKLDGIRYYTNPLPDEVYLDMLAKYNIDELSKIANLLDIQYENGENLRKVFFEEIINLLVSKTLIKQASTYKEAVYALVEHVAKKENIDRYKIYDFSELLKVTKAKIDLRGKKKVEHAIYRFVKYLDYTE